ncbi:MAG: response regulator [Clostridiaceae bacterium]
MNKIKVLIADDIEETRNVIKKILNLENEFFDVIGEASNGEEVLKLIPKVNPDVVLMDINMPVLNGLEATERITNEFPNVIVIIMSVQGEIEYLKKAMFHGAKEYIVKPFNYDALIDTIRITYEKYKDKTVNLSSSSQRTTNAKVVTYFSSKGGVGKSVLALNNAIVLSKDLNKRTLLIDLDLQFGDISMMVNQYNKKNIIDIIDEGQSESYENIKPYLYKYNENLDMLFAPTKPEAAEYITKESIEKIIKTFEKQYDFIIIDTGVNFNDSTLYALDIAQYILYVSTMEIVSLKNTKLGLQVMQSLNYEKDKVKLVINRATANYGISKNDVEAVFKDNIFAMIPDEEKVVSTSVNKGYPFCDEPKYYKTKIGKSIKDMCQSLEK